MAAQNDQRELRYITSTTFQTGFTNAAAAAFAAGTATKPRIVSLDVSGLTYEGVEDESLQGINHKTDAPHEVDRSGVLKFDMYGEGAYSNVDGNPVALLLGDILGGVTSPSTNRTDEANSDTTTTVLTVPSHGQPNWIGVLCGARGDSKGEGEFRIIVTSDTNTQTLNMATQGAMDASDNAVVYSTVCYFDETTSIDYYEFLALGKDATDQVQTLGGVGTFELGDLGPNEIPKFSFEFTAADWQEVPTANRDQLEPSTAASGASVAVDRGLGALYIADAPASAAARATLCVANVSVDPGVSWEPIACRTGGVNGVAGHIRNKALPTIEFDVILDGSADPLPGFYDDFTAGTAKDLLIQFGMSQGKTMAIYAPNFYFSAAPTRTSVGNLAAVKVMGYCGMSSSNTGATSALWRQYSPISFHFA